MKRFIPFLLAITVAIFITGYSKAKVNQSDKLTLDLIQDLSKKGTSLAWKDFEEYEGTDVGSFINKEQP